MGQFEDSELVNRLLQGVLGELEATLGARSDGVSVFQGVCEGAEGAQKLYRFRTVERFKARADTPVALRIRDSANDDPLVLEANVRSYTAGSLLLAVSHLSDEPIEQATLELGDESLILRKVRDLLQSLADALPSKPLLFHRDNAALALSGPTKPDREVADSITELPRELTPDQQAALRRSLSSAVTYIWGPAGTGKTTTLGALVHQLFRDYKRVLVVAHTNQAVDGMVAALCNRLSRREQPRQAAKPAEGSIVRLGSIVRRSLDEDFGVQIRFDDIVTKARQKMTLRFEEMQQELQEVKRALWRASHRAVLSEHINNLEQQHADLLAQTTSGPMSMGVRLLGSVLQKRSATAAPDSELRVQIALVEAGLDEARRRLAPSTEDRADADVTTLLEKQKDLAAGVELLEGFINDIRGHVLSRARVVACTTAKAILSFSELGEFDAVVIDEASMMTLPVTYLMAGLSKDKIIIAGDFRQLPPIARCQSEAAKHLYATSAFEASGVERLLGRGQAHSELATLTKQFRSHPKILDIFNRHFYGGILETAYNNPAVLAALTPALQRLEEHRAVIMDTSSLAPTGFNLDRSKANLVHAVVVQQLVQSLSATQEIAVSEVGVIAPYRPQVSLVQSLLREAGLDGAACCGTVHRFQGDERPTIILDLTESAPHRLGSFISGQHIGELSARLLNVALSRAQHYLLILADCAHLQAQLGPQHLIFSIIQELSASGAVINAADLIKRPDAPIGGLSSTLGQCYLLEGEHLYPALVADLLQSGDDITISSDTITPRGAAILQGIVASRVRAGVQATALLSQTPAEPTYSDLLKDGVKITVQQSGIKAPGAVIIDDRLVWLTSMPLFSGYEHLPLSALRIASPLVAQFFKRQTL